MSGENTQIISASGMDAEIGPCHAKGFGNRQMAVFRPTPGMWLLMTAAMAKYSHSLI
ncbi:MAG: hypothetical protein LBK73_02700 [Treponema sp.]|jgi:hypothetical protein|nr:hypothetical protein [Treponema sp.]